MGLLVAVCAPLGHAQSVAQQTIPLNAGWNLISFQVGGALTPAAFKASLDDPTTGSIDESQRLIEIWSYQPSGNPSVPGTWLTYQPTVLQFTSDLTVMQAGKAYWVNVSQFAQAALNGTRWDGTVALQPGWNLVGFPGLDMWANEASDPGSVFGTSFSRINQVWTFDTGLQRFNGYDVTAIPVLKELNSIRPGSGYWVYALEAVSIIPQPYVALPGDADGAPLQSEELFSGADARWQGSNPATYLNMMVRYAGPGDIDPAGDGNGTGGRSDSYDLNGNGILDTPFTQDTLKLDIGVDRKVITLGNQGAGLANWALNNTVPWLFTAGANAKAYPNNAGRPKGASGVISSERDTFTLHADATGLLPGIHTGTITVYCGTLTKTITVKLDVPVSSGDWKGYATTQSVNGRNVGIGAVDMGINLFMEEGSSTSFRAVLNRDTSLLFPRDVFMNGVFYSGNQFSLTTNFEMPAGDRNAPPFDTFQQPAGYSSLSGADRARADHDANGDRQLDISNPFPVPVRRQITLLGERKTPDRMEGSYIESVTGLLPNEQSIFIQGTFFLDRQTFAPTRRSIFNQSTTGSPILIGSTGGVLYRETTLTVGNSVSIQGMTLTLNLTFPDPNLLTITLIGPNGQSVVIHQGGGTLPTSVNLSQFNGVLGNGNWKVRVAWTPTAERGYFNGWGLNIQGLATYAITGKVVGDLDNNSGTPHVPLSGAHLALSGSNVISQAETGPFVFNTTTTTGSTSVTVPSTAGLHKDMPVTGNAAIPANAKVASIVNATTLTLTLAATTGGTAPSTFGEAGVFKFSGLTENNHTLSISRPGFDLRLITFFLNNANLYIGHGNGQGAASTSADTLDNDPIQLSLAGVAVPTLRVGPFIGQEPLYTTFTALIPVSNLDALGTIQSATWNFGDGSAPVVDTASSQDEVAQTTAKHTYQIAGAYIATLMLDGSLSDIVITSDQILVQRMLPDPAMPLTGNGQQAAQLIASGFVGSLAAPLSDAGAPVQLSEQGSVSQTIRVRQSNGTYVNTPLTAVPKAVVYQESRRGSGAFDLDRTPAMTSPTFVDFHTTAEDSDFSGQLYLMGDGTVSFPYVSRTFDQLTEAEQQTFAADNTPGTFTRYVPAQVGGVNVPERFRIITTLGGAVFATGPNKVGDLLLQPGRVEP